jgi:pimeloyl-ACP methyl ester carboxylesterase
VLPSIPGYAFSAQPTELGWHAGRFARAWAELMSRLGDTDADRGGHFAAWEEPQLFAEEMRSAFRILR